MYKLTLSEMETTMNFDRNSDTARIYTADPVMMRKMDKLALESACVQVVSHDEYSRTYICPKSWMKVHKPRQLSEERRAELAQRFQHEQRAKGGENTCQN